MSATLIGLGGHLRAGKDAVADRLVAAHGFVKIGMSDALNEAMLAINPIILDPLGKPDELPFIRYADAVKVFGYVEAKKHPEVRRLLQALGTEVGRDMIGEDTWANITAGKVDALLRAGQSVAVTGIRFPNELRMVSSFAGRSIWVERPGLDSSTPASTHASENSVSAQDFDTVLLNDGTLDALYAKVDALVSPQIKEHQ